MEIIVQRSNKGCFKHEVEDSFDDNQVDFDFQNMKEKDKVLVKDI